jgi:twitching motility two-component system response regulator PilG
MNALIEPVDIGPTRDWLTGTPYKVLEDLFARKVSGRLTIEVPSDRSVQWHIYLGDGKVCFAGSAMGHQERLEYLLGRYFNKKQFSLPEDLNDDYHYICNLWKRGELELQEARYLLAQLTQEALIHSLALPRAYLKFNLGINLNPILIALNLKSLVLPVKKQIRYWLQLRSDISSPFHKPLTEDSTQLYGLSWIDHKEINFLRNFRRFFDGEHSLYKIGKQENINILDLALKLQPMVNCGGIKMLPYKEPEKEINLPLIACIDDSKAIQRSVKMTLEVSGFRVLSILEPAKAMSTFVRNRPDLILMDINMPEIDGYRLSYMLRQSALLKDIPIIMLTGRDGALDRVKAKMVGAAAYVSKPFNPQELISIISEQVKLIKEA